LNSKTGVIPAVVIGTHTMGLGVIRALGRMGVPVVALYYRRDDMGFVSKYVWKSIHVPHPETEECRFIDCLIDLASRMAGSPLIPVSDESLKIVSRNKSLLQHYFKVACPEWEVVRKLLEKNLTYELAKVMGVPIPQTGMPASMEEAISLGNDLGFPCLLKPVESHSYYDLFRRKLVRVENTSQLAKAFREVERAGSRVMLQEFIPGEDSLGVNYNSYFWNGQPTVEFTAKKLRNAPPEFGSPCAVVSREIPAVLDAGRRILRAMNFYGYSCIEFKCDPRDGIYKLMEVNGRHNLSTLLAVNCGINFPWLHYRHLVEGIVPENIGFQENYYWVDVERDLTYIPKRVFCQKESLSQILEPYLHPHVAAIYDSKDIKPFLKRYTDFSKKVMYRLFRKE
jgi:predicted ATP-grasp superfamily ATP-dependent carboligase